MDLRANLPKDFRKVKTKIALNLTKRQLICFSIGGLIGVPFYLGTKAYIGTDSSVLMMVFLMLPWFIAGIYEKDGLPLEQVLLNVIRYKWVYPQVRTLDGEKQGMSAVNNKEAKVLDKNKKETDKG